MGPRRRAWQTRGRVAAGENDPEDAAERAQVRSACLSVALGANPEPCPVVKDRWEQEEVGASIGESRQDGLGCCLGDRSQSYGQSHLGSGLDSGLESSPDSDLESIPASSPPGGLEGNR
jgi:hypothetical protein